MSQSITLPKEIDLLIIGGGTSGAALAGIIARDTDLQVVLLEAGPDYGPLSDGRWPAELLDARRSLPALMAGATEAWLIRPTTR